MSVCLFVCLSLCLSVSSVYMGYMPDANTYIHTYLLTLNEVVLCGIEVRKSSPVMGN